jgi:hypothetical protein
MTPRRGDSAAAPTRGNNEVGDHTMRRVSLFTPIGTALLLASASFPLRAQGNPQDQRLGPNTYFLTLGLAGGTVIPTGNGSSGVPHGSSIQGYALVQVPGFLCLRFNLGYQKWTLPNALQGQPNYNGTNQSLLNAVGGLQIFLIPGPVRPYITAGLGAYKYTTNPDTTTGAPNVSSINFGINGGAGIAFRFGRFSAFGEGIIQNVYTNTGGFVKSAKNIAAIPVNFGLAIGII